MLGNLGECMLSHSFASPRVLILYEVGSNEDVGQFG